MILNGKVRKIALERYLKKIKDDHNHLRKYFNENKHNKTSKMLSHINTANLVLWDQTLKN